jgi:hypothetical protein
MASVWLQGSFGNARVSGCRPGFGAAFAEQAHDKCAGGGEGQQFGEQG